MRFPGIILAAGRQTRFQEDLPKCLLQYDDDLTILEKNIDVLSRYCDGVCVVVNKNINNDELISVAHLGFNRVHIIKIESGLGTGHAVYETLKQIQNNEYKQTVVLTWADSIQDQTSVIDATINNYNGKCTVPLKFEDKCYMKFLTSSITNNIIKVYRPQGGLHLQFGLHDFSLFRFDMAYIYVLLDLYHEKYFNGFDYNTKSRDMNFIDLFNEFGLSNFANAVIIDDPKISSINAFNTIEEYDEIIKRRSK